VPKGVVLSHRNIIANTNSIIKYLNLNQLDRICVILPFYYCYGLSLLHTHLKVGGSIVLNNTFLFLGTVINDIKNYKCTAFAGVPSHFQMLLKKSTSFKNTVFPDLKYVTQAGGKLHDVFIKEFVETFPNVNFNVMYGQTEATARLSYLSSSLVLEKLGSIGKAIPDVTLKIVDKNDVELPDGEIGEIIAKGDNVMQGYYKDIEMSEKTLINGWLHTGDLAKKDKEGFIYIVAREKEIIKVGGKRVSPKEIEEVILSVSEVVDCSIKAFDDEILGESLKAIVVIDNKFEENEIKDKILRKCKEKLALYKIPQMFEFESNMRVKPTGKK
jgi:acyl-CoA synthetase (AMP-forming)/AMP-acid ligase II